MVKRSEAFPRRHFSADDVANGAITLTIARTQQETLRNNGQEQVKTVLYFKGGHKPLPVNKVNWDSVVSITGEDDSDNWGGHQIEAYQNTTHTPSGDTVPCVRLRAPAQGELKPKAERRPPARKPIHDDVDDEIPIKYVVDVDSDDAEAVLRRLEAEHDELPPTIEVITGKGRHIYFRMPPASRVPNTAGRIAPGIDTRGEHGYVLAPPSVHASGKRYCWSGDSAAAFAEAPQWLLNKITGSTSGNGSKPPAPPAEWRALLDAGAVEGCRDATVTRLAGYLLRRHEPGTLTSRCRDQSS